MRKQIISALTVTALVLAMGLSALAVGEVSSITGGIDASSDDVLTTQDSITDEDGNAVLVEDAEGSVIKITTVSQASNANEVAGEGATVETVANNSRTVGQNQNLIDEYEKTKDAQTAKEALDIIGATAAVEESTGIPSDQLDNYAEIQILDIAFSKGVQESAQSTSGVTIAMRVSGIGEDSNGFVVYYDEEGKPHVVRYKILSVDENGNARISFTLPNPSVVRIYTSVNL